MKAKLFALLCLAAPAVLAAVSETPEEIHSSGDFNGDGRQDLVIVDKTSGVYRIGYGQPSGSNFWVEARPSGIEHITGLGIGRILDTTRDALAFTSPDANRVNVLGASDPNVAAQPVNVFLNTLGPNLVVPLDIGGLGNTAVDDLFSTSLANSPPASFALSLTRPSGLHVFGATLAGEGVAADRVQLKTGGANLAGVLLDTGPNYTFVAYNPATGTPAVQVSTNDLPPVDGFVFANFANSALKQFLFYRGGASNLVLRPVLEPLANSFQFGAGAAWAFDAAIRQIVTVPGSSDTRLLITFGGGEDAAIYSFDGTNAPVLVESFEAAPGEAFTGSSALGNGNFSLYSGAEGRSKKFQNWNRSGNGYTKGSSGELPEINSLGNAGNVFLFQDKPFVNPKPRLLGTLNASDWSSSINLADPLHVTANSEKFRSSVQGLGSATVKDLGAKPAGGAFGLPNQIAESFSLLSFSPAEGSTVAEVKASPAPGRYPVGVSVVLSSPTAGAVIQYRIGGGTWAGYTQPIPLFRDTTISFYAVAGGKKSAIRSATYTFDTPPSTLDTDGDGVPDFVELGYDSDNDGIPDYAEMNEGLDPVRGKKDSDGDGYADLAEILAGTNPYSTNSVPTNAPRADELAAFDWQVQPRPLAGYVAGLAGCSTGTVVSAFDLHGGLIDSVATKPSSFPDAYFSNMFANASQRLYIAATEPHYDVRSNFFPNFPAGVDHRVGREMIRLLPVPAFASALAVNYTYGGGNLKAEANAWIAAAQAAQSAIQHPILFNVLTWEDTLAALLTERKVGELLVNRGLLASSNQITLFPFRPQDAGRINPPHTNLLALETNALTSGNLPDPLKPGNKLTNIFHKIHLAVNVSPSPQAFQLRNLARDIYRISALSNNIAPGKFPSPVDTLRGFIETGTLHSNYLAATSVPAPDRAAAVAAVGQALASVNGRPTTNLTLRVRPDSFSSDGCSVLETAGGALMALVLPDGTAYKFPEAFMLAPQSVVDVVAYTDLAPSCGAQTLDVITLTVTALPAVSSTDLDGDLMSDAWEALFLAYDPNADADGDGASNLQEFLDGTDPLNQFSAGVPADMSPPQIVLEALAGDLKLSWHWPELYASKMNFALLSTEGLNQAFAATPAPLQTLGGGNFQIVLPSSGGPAKFYRLQLSLK